MFKHLILCKLLLLTIVQMSLPVSQAQTSAFKGSLMRISSYDDDPFVNDSIVERMDPSRFQEGEDGRPILGGNLVWIAEETVIYRQDPNDGMFKPFAWNPWPLPLSNARGDFRFKDEERFPLHRVERDAEGRIVLRDGLQLWLPQDLHRGMTTTFEAANAAKDAAGFWAGRELTWGDNGQLGINAHAFIGFNAFYSPSARGLFFGVVPYRLPGQTDIKMFETATSWEIAAHESGHAIHHTIKPNVDLSDYGYRTWSESFADQVAMWTSLRDRDRLLKLLAGTSGDLNQSHALTRIGEVFAALVGEGTGLRDAFHDKKVSNTSIDIHDRSEVLTGAIYKLFLTVYSGLKSDGGKDQEALSEAGRIMGTFLTRSTDYTPENRMTLEDVAKAYLKVDKEFYHSRYHAMLVDEFTRREIFDAYSVSEWMAHETAVPDLRLSPRSSDHDVEELVQSNLYKLRIGPNFGLKLQSMTRDNHLGQTIVRVQLTMGRGDNASPLNNHGILTFRRNGTLADYHSPLPSEMSSPMQAPAQIEQAEQLLPLIAQAQWLRLDQFGAPLSIVHNPDGRLTMEARVIRSEGINTYMMVFTLDNPQGERREIVISPVPPSRHMPIPEDLLK